MKIDFRSRLRTVDTLGNRIWVYADLFEKGLFRQRRGLLAVVLVLIYSGVPWVRVDGMPLLQFDFRQFRLVFGGVVFWPHEVPLFVPLFIGGILVFFALTAIFGRVFCGWFCPQTVFLEFIYRPLEHLLEGSPNQQRNLNSGPRTWRKVMLKTIKWSLFGVISFLVANCFLGYFIGTDELLAAMTGSPLDHLFTFGVMLVVWAGFTFNFGWFREQMCTIACPYGRLQSMLTDRHTWIVAYDTVRGEPRGKHNTGHCIDCKRCVQVCPTGIDIRDGLQLECTGCLACVDVCNDVMDHVHRPRNLIAYTTDAKLKKRSEGKRSIRPWVYVTLGALLVGVSGWRLATRSSFDVVLMRESATDFEIMGDVVQSRRGFIVENKLLDAQVVRVSAVETDTQVTMGVNRTEIAPKDKIQSIFFISVPRSAFHHGHALRHIQFTNHLGEVIQVDIPLLGPDH